MLTHVTEAQAQLVVIGASAGGVEALSTLVSTLPAGFPAPIVIAQHLDPSRTSHLEEILARRTNLPVKTVLEKEKLRTAVIYVVPSDRHVDIADHTVSVHPQVGHVRPSPSIDRLMGTAAEAYGEQLIAVVLTGLGSDGADGARRVKGMGGTVVIQNPQTATHPEMPLSLAPTTVDIVAELEAIGPLLHELLAGTYAPARPDDGRRLRSVLDQVRARSGIDFSTYKEPTIRRRLQRRMLDTGNNNLEDYLRHLRRHPEEYARLANSFLIKVTDFFRDPDLFAYLREQLLPGLIDEARTRGNELRLWSAGCATGEEAYSLAILVSELLGSQLDQCNVRIFATDLDTDAVAFARRGIYPASALKNLPRDLRERYLTRGNGAFEVRKEARSLVIFGQHDLGQRAPFPRIDLVLCRNVLIYFTPELQRRALQLFAFALREGGSLVLGKAESTSPLPEHFTLVNQRLKIFRRQGERVLIPPMRMRDPVLALSGDPTSRTALSTARAEQTHMRSRPPGSQTTAERAEQILLELPVGVVVVDRKYDIQAINVLARRLLGIHTPAIGEDLVHLAYRSLGGPLRDAVDTAIVGEGHHTVHEVSSLPDDPGERRFFELVSFVHGVSTDAPDRDEAIVLLIADVTSRERERTERAAALAEAEARADHVQELLDDSARTVRQLLQANQELATSNARMHSANEELLMGGEEAQAAMEEVETLNEEQQATNEELETLNEELQATVEELNTTNEDLQARTLELHEQAAEREGLLAALAQERQRLEAILSSMADAVLVVDKAAAPVLTNAAFTRQFGDSLPALQDVSGRKLSTRANPVRRAARGETFTQDFTIVGPDEQRRWFEASGMSIQSSRGIQGGVLVIRDVTDRSVRQLQDQFVTLASHELRMPLTALRGSLEMLLRSLPLDGGDSRVGRYASISLEQSRLLTDLVQDLSDVVRVQSGQLAIERQSVDLVEVVQAAVELARPMAEGLEIRVEAPESLPIEGDRRRLQQVLLNLLSNAVQYGSTPAGIVVRLESDDQEAVLEVIDSGPGIPAEDHQRIFDRFYRSTQTSAPGLGVGLYVVRAIVAGHGGTVHVESNDGHGAAFVVRLPCRVDVVAPTA
jgi:two-component system, chemotaxis family, CheB/CheR fusion protein